MGMGMLFAGALTGGAKAAGELADETIRRQAEEAKRQTSIMDRRNELLWEMKVKSDMARRSELDDAQEFESATERAAKVGDDRRFGKFRDDIRASGGGEGMSDDQLREVFNTYYNNKISTEEAGGDRYVEPESRAKADVLGELRNGGASGGLLKQAREDLNTELRTEAAARTERFKEKQLAQQAELATARNENMLARQAMQNEAMLARIAASASRGGSGGGSDSGEPKKKPNTTLDIERAINATDAEIAKALNVPAERVPQALRTLANSKNPEDVQKLEEIRRLQKSARDLAQQMRGMVLPEGGEAAKPPAAKPAEPQKTAAPQSTVKDNRSSVGAAPVKVNDKAGYDALPKGARYVAPDGTVRTKG